MAFDFSPDPEFDHRLEWMQQFLRDEIFPLEVLDVDQHRMDALMAPLKDRVKREGLWAAHLDTELGGQGFGQVKLGLMNEIIGQSRLAPIAFGNAAPDAGNSEILAVHATDDQRDRYLRPLLAGEKTSAYAMTEPDAGADPTMLTTLAVRDGDEWIINGDKWFITNASIADFFIVMVVTDPDAPRHQRASQLIVDAGTPGLEIVRELGSLEDAKPVWGRVDNHAEVRFRDVRVPAKNMLGGQGEGFLVSQQRLGPGRIQHAMRWLGQARRAFDMLCERSLYRRAFGTPLADKQTVQNWIADSAAEMHAARLMTLHAAWKIDHHGAAAARKEIAIIKFWGAKVLHDVIDRALQAHGSLGYSSDLPLEQMYRYARAARIYDGPDEVHRQSVSRLVLRDYTVPESGLPTEYIPTRRDAALERFAAVLEQHTATA
jgi:acyl-CoA dehydrogenase